jgi:hypothetical protein
MLCSGNCKLNRSSIDTRMMIVYRPQIHWQAHNPAALLRCRMNDLDTAISKAHSAAEDTENQSRQLEARICKIPGAARYLPSRRYGSVR